MACGLWGCLKLKALRRDLAPEEIHTAEDISNDMVWFLTTDKCMGFVEASLILHFSERSTTVLDNIEDVLNNSRPEDHSGASISFAKFREARHTMMSDLAYILVLVWPKDDLPEYWISKYLKRPQGFNDRPLAVRLLQLAKRYEWLLWGKRATSINCFAINGTG